MGLRTWLGLKESVKEEPVKDESGDDDLKASQDSMQRPFKYKRFLEQLIPLGNPDQGTEFDDRFFKNITQATSLDLSNDRIQTAQRLSFTLHHRNPRAFRTNELIKNFVLADGVRFRANDPKVQAVLDQHWEANEWADKSGERLLTLGIFGEQLYPVFIGGDGLVLVPAIPPTRILTVRSAPGNAEEADLVVTNIGSASMMVQGIAQHQTAGKSYKIIRPNQRGEMVGDAFFFAVNRISGALRGLPDILPSIDFLEGLDNFVFALLERAEISQNVVFDVLYKGLQDEEIRERVNEFVDTITNGGAFGHNENVELKIQQPNMGASEAETVVKVFLKHIQAGTGLAGLFFGDSDDLTRASASELTAPVAKMIQSRQSFFRRMLERIFIFQIQKALEHGRLKGVTDFTFQIEMPQVFLRDMTQIANAQVALGNSLALAVEQEWISNAQAGDIYKMALQQIGPISEGGSTIPEIGNSEEEVIDIMDQVRGNGIPAVVAPRVQQ